MSNEKKTVEEMELDVVKQEEMDLEQAAYAAEKEQDKAMQEPDVTMYTHTFKEPFQYRGKEIRELVFDWGSLTGKDALSIEDEMLRHGQTLVVPAFTGSYLIGMAVRACTLRDDKGLRIVDADMLYALPIREYQKIYMSARRFLLRAGS